MAISRASELVYSEFFVETDPGVRIFVDSYGDESHPTVLFSNPLTATTAMWGDVIRNLPVGWRYICYDPRGTGRSTAPAGSYDIEGLGRDVIRIMDAVGITETIFCGVSLGGLTGIWLGAHCPGRLRGLILANTAANFPPKAMWDERADGALKAGMQQFVEPTLRRWFSSHFRESGAPGVRLVEQMVATMEPVAYASLCRVLGETNLLSQLPLIKCPVKIISGSLDESTPPVRAIELLEGLPNADLVTLTANHVPAIEQPAEFARVVERFLQDIKGR